MNEWLGSGEFWQGIWLYNAGNRQGSSDFFLHQWRLQELRSTRLEAFAVERAIAADPDRTLLGWLAASQQTAAPAAAGARIPCRYLATLFSENSSIRANLFGIVPNAAPFLSLMQGSPAHCWQTLRVCLMLGRCPRWNSTHREGMSLLQWHESPLCALG